MDAAVAIPMPKGVTFQQAATIGVGSLVRPLSLNFNPLALGCLTLI